MTINQFEIFITTRNKIIRSNAGLRMAGKADQQVPVSPVPPAPKRKHLYVEGEWSGTIDHLPADDLIAEVEEFLVNFYGEIVPYEIVELDYRLVAP